jgi:glycosyltransferase involved in cell wall biosynthesis
MRGLIQYFAKRLERRLIKSADAVCVVNHIIADWYKKNYCLEYVWVVHNAPYQMGAMPKRKGLLRKAIGVQDHELLFIYQGLLSSGRGIEILLQVFSNSGINKHVVFMGYGPNESLVRQAAMCNPNIHFMPAVSPKLVFDYTVDADVGLSLIEDTCLSYYLCAPNKLYEYAACGVVPIVSNFPEMSSFIDKYDCGWKIEPTAVALGNLLKSIDKETIAIKRVNAIDAGAQHCWENEEQELMLMYKSLKL